MKRILILILVALPFLSNAQGYNYKARKCFGYERDSCKTDTGLSYKRQENSRSALFVKGQSSKTYMKIYNGRDYRISLCWDPILGDHVLFKIIDDVSNNVLYDNSTDEFATEFEFTVTQSADIYIEVTVPGESGLSKASADDNIIIIRKDREMGCVGILIEHMITPVKGF